MKDIKSIINAIKNLIEENNWPEFELNKPAKPRDIEKAEKKMKLQFPKDYRQFLLAFNGMNTDAIDSFPWLPNCDPLSPLKEVMTGWKQELECLEYDIDSDYELIDNSKIKDIYYHNQRIPIAGGPFWDGDLVFIDLDPGPNGTSGQLIHRSKGGDFHWIDSSFNDSINRWLQALVNKEWIYDISKQQFKPGKNRKNIAAGLT